ncbi:MAG: FAD-dependent oxidoreductase, partial [Actinomycetia bacterium]|nr:FAD-dependent oxidoreductase [Actinomycetes bacterium]
MSEQDYDAIIIGTGVIGAAVAYELARRGRRTLNIDKLPAAGYGSTSNSCAIIRFSYSTYDGVAMSWEGQHYWADWHQY